MTKIIVYTTPYCGYCSAATHLLSKKSVLTEIDASEDMELREDMISRAFGGAHCRRSSSNVIDIGRYDELAEVERRGKLDTLLAEAYALGAHSRRMMCVRREPSV
jgi:glutaredoxin 3